MALHAPGLHAAMPAHAYCVFGAIGIARNLYQGEANTPTVLNALYEPIASYQPTRPAHHISSPSPRRYEACGALDRPIDGINNTVTYRQCGLPSGHYREMVGTSNTRLPPAHLKALSCLVIIQFSSLFGGTHGLFGLDRIPSRYWSDGALLLYAIAFGMGILVGVLVWVSRIRANQAELHFQLEKLEMDNDELLEVLQTMRNAESGLRIKLDEHSIAGEGPVTASKGTQTVQQVYGTSNVQEEDEMATETQDEEISPMIDSPQLVGAEEQRNQKVEAALEEPSAPQRAREVLRDISQDSFDDTTIEDAAMQNSSVPQVAGDASDDSSQDRAFQPPKTGLSAVHIEQDPFRYRKMAELRLKRTRTDNNPTRLPKLFPEERVTNPEKMNSEDNDGVVCRDAAADHTLEAPREDSRDGREDRGQDVDASERGSLSGDDRESDDDVDDDDDDSPSPGASAVAPGPQLVELNGGTGDDTRSDHAVGLEGLSGAQRSSHDAPVERSIFEASQGERSGESLRSKLKVDAIELLGTQGGESGYTPPPAPQITSEVPQETAHESIASSSDPLEQIVNEPAVLQTAVPDVPSLIDKHDVEIFASSAEHQSSLPEKQTLVVCGPGASTSVIAGEAPQEAERENSAVSTISPEQTNGDQAVLQTAVPDVPHPFDQQDDQASAAIASAEERERSLLAEPEVFVFDAGTPRFGVDAAHDSPVEPQPEHMELDLTNNGVNDTDGEQNDGMDVDEELLNLVGSGSEDDGEDNSCDENMSDVPRGEIDDDQMSLDESEQEDHDMSDDEAWNEYVKDAERQLFSEYEDEVAPDANMTDATHGADDALDESNAETAGHVNDDARMSDGEREWPDSKDIHLADINDEGEMDDGLSSNTPESTGGENDGGQSNGYKALPHDTAQNKKHNSSEAVSRSRFIKARDDFPTEAEIQLVLPPEGMEPKWLLSLFAERVPEAREREFFLLVGKVGKARLGTNKYFPRTHKNDNTQQKINETSLHGSPQDARELQENEDDTPTPNDKQHPPRRQTAKDFPTEDEIVAKLPTYGLPLDILLMMFNDRVPEKEEQTAKFKKLLENVADLDESTGLYKPKAQ